MTHLVGQTLNRYQLLALLGEGGMGAVYRARDPELQRDVAIKVMHDFYARQPNFRERFLQEARVAANLHHTGIVTVHDFGQIGETLYLVMEFIAGENLAELMHGLRQQQRWIPLAEALQLAQQIATALDYAHRQGVLHRDIKPANIMLRAEKSGALPYQPVITDLGLAKLSQGGVVTQTGTSLGTPAYMSPEQALGEETDARSDVYSLGVLLYELVVGQRPFPANTLSEAIRYYTRSAPPPPATLRPDVPDAVAQIILQALEKEPAKRFQSAGALAEALTSLPTATLVTTVPPTAVNGASGLLTQYQASLVGGRGSSLLDEFPTPPPGGNPLIQLLGPDGRVQNLPLEARVVTIGRHAQNQIVLPDDKASSRHARIEFDGRNYRVTDLDSTNGTYLGQAKLLPGAPEVWLPDQPLRIGNHYLRLLLSGNANRDGTQIGERLDAPSINVALFTIVERLEVTAGERVTLPLILINQGTQVDHFTLSGEGTASQWLQTPAPVQLMPGAQQEVQLQLQPPRSAKTRAGDHPLTIRVKSRSQPSLSAARQITVHVLPYYAFTGNLYPQEAPAGKAMQVALENQGNSVRLFEMSWADRAAALNFMPPKTELKVEPGEKAVVEFAARPQRRRWFGNPQTHPLTVQIQPQQGGEPTNLSGAVVSRALLPAWVPALLLLLLLGLGALIWNGLVQRQTAVVAAQQTAAAIALLPLATQTAQAIATETAVSAATSTAVWLDGDDDRDGLTNRQELQLNTLPSNRDTDQDGLDDGEEVNKWGTDPLKADTDGDGLKDGDEVSRGINPQAIDTDQDGINDAADPDPGHVPTPVPLPTAAPLPTEAPTPPPIPTDAPTEAPTAPSPTVANFAGTWFTNFAEMHLTQNGDRVTGNYNWYGSSETFVIEGTVSGNALSGTYMNMPDTAYTFVMADDQNSFDGHWVSRSKGGTRHWCGVRSGPLPDGCGFSGAWLAKSNNLPFQWQPSMNIRQEGATVVGTFDNGNPNGTGTISGQIGTFGKDPHYTFVGVYRMDVGGFSDNARWTLQNNDDRQFVGCSISNGGVADWLGWRQGESEPASDHPQSCP